MQTAMIAGPKKDAKGRGDSAPAAVRFTRASAEHTEPGGYDATVSAATFGTGPTTITFDVPSVGFLKRLLLLVETDGNGAAGGTNAVAQADAPWTFIKSITFKDVNGGNVVGPLDGFGLFLKNKWGGYKFDANPVNDPNYSAIDTDGEFSYRLDVNLEAIARDALGALPNQNASNTYKIELVVADDGDVYSTAPGTLPGVRVRAFLEAWMQPSAADPLGNPQQTAPQNPKTTQFWTRASIAVPGSGEFTWRLPKVGNYLRNLVFVFRDSGGAREGATFAGTVKLSLDGQVITNEATAIRRAIMAEAYGYALNGIGNGDFDEGVIVYDFTHDFDGHPGGEFRDLWLPTMQSSRLELTLANAGEAGTLECYTNDVAISSVP